MVRVLWTKERDDALKQLRRDGLSFEEARRAINSKFGTGYSRVACIGRASRLGLCQTPVEAARSRAKVAAQREEAKQIEREHPELGPVKRRRRRYRVPPPIALVTAPPIAPNALPVGSIASRTIHAIKRAGRQFGDIQQPDTRPIRCAEITPKHLSIMELTQETCRWPCGGWPEDTPITFCGHWCPKDEPYCDAHQALAVGWGTPSERAADRVSSQDKAA